MSGRAVARRTTTRLHRPETGWATNRWSHTVVPTKTSPIRPTGLWRVWMPAPRTGAGIHRVTDTSCQASDPVGTIGP